MVEFNYNKRKIYLFLGFSILMLSLFGWIFLDAEILALREPKSSYSRYRWVGKLFYHNKNLIQYLSAIIFLLFVFFATRLIIMLKKKSMIFKIQHDKLYQDEKYLTQINQISNLQLKSVNKNHFIKVFLKNPKIIIENEPNLLKKINYKIINYTENTPLSLNIDFLKNKPENILEQLKKLIA